MTLSPFTPLPHRLDRRRFPSTPVTDPANRIIIPHRRFRLPILNMAVDGTAQRDSVTGALYRDSTHGGIVRNAWDDQNKCCCVIGSCPCGSGSGHSTGTLKITFSGVTIPTSCMVREWTDSFPTAPDGTSAVHSAIAGQFSGVTLNGTYCLHLDTTCGATTSFTGSFDQWNGGWESGTYGLRGSTFTDYTGTLQTVQGPNYCSPPTCGCTDGVHTFHVTSGIITAILFRESDSHGTVTGTGVAVWAYFILSVVDPLYIGTRGFGMCFNSLDPTGVASPPLLNCGGSATLTNYAQWCASGGEGDVGCTWNNMGGTAVVTDVVCT